MMLLPFNGLIGNKTTVIVVIRITWFILHPVKNVPNRPDY